MTLVLEWILIGETNTSKSSPECIVEWRDRRGIILATHTLQPYDSTRLESFLFLCMFLISNQDIIKILNKVFHLKLICLRGRQFVQLNLSLLKDAEAGEWTVTVTGEII